MQATRWLAVVVLVVGCGSNDSTPDGGTPIGDDAGALPGEDGGSMEADGGGMEEVDGGPALCGSVAGAAGRFPDLPAGCLPRCTTETAMAVGACTEQSCRDEAMFRDGAPTAMLETPRGTQSLTCFDCFHWQSNGCSEEFCPDQVAARWACLAEHPSDASACGEQTLALNNCVAAVPAADLEECANRRMRACFP